MFRFHLFRSLFCLFLVATALSSSAQLYDKMTWSTDGNSFYENEDGSIIKYTVKDLSRDILLPAQLLIPAGRTKALDIKNFFFSNDFKKILIYTNAKKVWRYETRGDYWIFNFSDSSLKQLGKGLPSSSLMFAKFSPDGNRAAYVSEHNLFVEDLSTHIIKPLTHNGSRKMINGTFDWVYEEEFDCRDGFRWSPDSHAIAYWQINDSSTRDYYMLNTTDSVYSRVVPVEYPVAGQMPSPFKIAVVEIRDNQTHWMKIPTDAKNGTYLPRMEWASNGQELVVQRLNRSQNESDILLCNAKTGEVKSVYSEKESAWVDIISAWDDKYKMGGWDWLNNGNEFLWASEKDGWRHLYRISRDGKRQVLITHGNYDVMEISLIDEKNNQVYFMASPDNATQSYLYRCNLDGSGTAQRVTPANEPGSHSYEFSPNGKYAEHHFSNYYTSPAGEWITLPDHQAIAGTQPIRPINPQDSASSNISFFKILTADGVSMDGWMQKPIPFDSTKKYPVLFYVYTEPAAQTVRDVYGITHCPVYPGNWIRMVISIFRWTTGVRLHQKGQHGENPFTGKSDRSISTIRHRLLPRFVTGHLWILPRIAVWGWSGGGSATLNLMFQHPEIYKTGLAIAAAG